jgi:hypothetical protein
MSKPSRRFCARPYALHANLRDVVLAGVIRRVEALRGRMSKGVWQGKALFQSLLAIAFDGEVL